MTLNFQPYSEKELQEDNVLPDGYYALTCVKATNKATKDGIPFIAAQLKTHYKGRDRFVFVNLMSHAFRHLLKHYYDSCGKPEIFQSGQISTSNVISQNVYAKICIKEYQGQLQNQVVDFLTKDKFDQAKAEEAGQNQVEFSDEIPF